MGWQQSKRVKFNVKNFLFEWNVSKNDVNCVRLQKSLVYDDLQDFHYTLTDAGLVQNSMNHKTSVLNFGLLSFHFLHFLDQSRTYKINKIFERASQRDTPIFFNIYFIYKKILFLGIGLFFSSKFHNDHHQLDHNSITKSL